ncbi:MAG: hypothetical protein HW391_2075 [Chloroflexi bacterium]|nr:hypothetical protein [Chloroflexota bacterium]
MMAATEPADDKPGRVRIENVNHPGNSATVDAGMYNAMRDALLAVLPDAAPGLTESQMRTAVVPKLPPDLYPGGARAGWWTKAVQLDLEAKGVITREPSRPLRWHHPAEGTRPATPPPPRGAGSVTPRRGTRSG